MVFLLALYAMSLFGCRGASETAATDQPVRNITTNLQQTPPNPAPDTTVALTPEEAQIIASMEAALEKLAAKSPTAAELLAFYRENSVKVRYITETTFQAVESSRTDMTLLVAADPHPVEHGANATYVAASFNMDVNALVFHETRFCELANGLYFAHELVHAYDLLTGQELVSDPLTMEWLVGEYRANALTHRMLNEYTDGGWVDLVRHSMASRESTAAAEGEDPGDFMLGLFPGDVEGIMALLGPMDQNNMNVFLTQLEIDANMMNIESRAGGDSAAAGIQLQFLYVFYAQAMEEMGGP